MARGSHEWRKGKARRGRCVPVVLALLLAHVHWVKAAANGDEAHAVQPSAGGSPDPDRSHGSPRRTGRVRLHDHALSDDQGPFLGLGVSYFTALWRYRYDRARLPGDLAKWRSTEVRADDSPLGADGCLSMVCSQSDGRILCVPVGIEPRRFVLVARSRLRLRACDLLTGQELRTLELEPGERVVPALGAPAVVLMN